MSEAGLLAPYPAPGVMGDAVPAARLADQDWSRIESELDGRGAAVLPGLLDAEYCDTWRGLYADEEGSGRFRSTVQMARHGFGQGEYRYFAYPLPPALAALRTVLYERLSPIANRWTATTNGDEAPAYPVSHAEFLRRCHAQGQTRPTPLMLRYRAGDYNCLHQDLYGALAFPLQMAILLSRPERDFTGGEFVLTEQRPRLQSRVEVVPLGQGDAVIFAVNQRPVRGTRGSYRVRLRHGVSRVRSGERFCAGIILHDAT